MRSLPLALLAAAALVAAGCGGSDAKRPEDVVSTAVSALAKGDATKVCAQFSAAGRRSLLVELRAGPLGLPKIRERSCTVAVGKFYAALPKVFRNVLVDGEVDKAKVSGNTATVHVTGAGVTAKLRKIGGDWKIDGGLLA